MLNNNDLQAYSQAYVYPSGAGTAYYSRAQKFTVFNRVTVVKSLFFCVVFFLLLLVFFFWLLSFLYFFNFWFLIGIFKLFVHGNQ